MNPGFHSQSRNKKMIFDFLLGMLLRYLSEEKTTFFSEKHYSQGNPYVRAQIVLRGVYFLLLASLIFVLMFGSFPVALALGYLFVIAYWEIDEIKQDINKLGK